MTNVSYILTTPAARRREQPGLARRDEFGTSDTGGPFPSGGKISYTNLVAQGHWGTGTIATFMVVLFSSQRQACTSTSHLRLHTDMSLGSGDGGRKLASLYSLL